MGNRREVPVRDGVAVLQIGTIPSSLELSGGKPRRIGRQVVNSDSGGIVLPGRKGS
jgi:hypothetical protein